MKDSFQTCTFSGEINSFKLLFIGEVYQYAPDEIVDWY